METFWKCSEQFENMFVVFLTLQNRVCAQKRSFESLNAT